MSVGGELSLWEVEGIRFSLRVVDTERRPTKPYVWWKVTRVIKVTHCNDV